MAHITARNPRRTLKSRSGCATCKRRRVKCDEGEPSCRRCTKTGLECPGYSRPVRWSTKYEKNSITHLDSANSCAESFAWFESHAKKLSTAIAPPSPAGLLTIMGHRDEPRVRPDQASTIESPSTTVSLQIESPNLEDQNHESPALSAGSSLANQFDLSPAPSTGDIFEESADDVLANEDMELIEPCFGDCDLSLSLYAPTEQSSVLLDHYFSLTCRITSCFDSLYNPFRSEVSRMIVDSPLVFNCVMSMSAAHLYQNDQGNGSGAIPLGFQTEAISLLSIELAKIAGMEVESQGSEVVELGAVVPRQTSLVRDDVLLGIILLGMTSAWHNPSSLGLSHLHGSRQLFKAWMSSNALDDPNKPPSVNKTQSFLVSSMVYWEAMSSFLLDQETEALSYLDIFCSTASPSMVYPHPWTGVATPVFIFLAKVGTLMRKKRVLRNLRLFKNGEAYQRALYSELLEEARTVEQNILKCRIPFISLIEDIGDPHTTPEHFHAIGRCYRLAALLELYRAFPEIIEDESRFHLAADFAYDPMDNQSQLVLGLAFGILRTLEMVPDDSHTISTQNLLLLIAGSALAQFSPNQLQETPAQAKVNDEVAQWRRFVRNRVLHLYTSIGLRPIKHVAITLEEVWSRMDIVVKSGSVMGDRDNVFSDQVHWMDIMAEKKLETMLG
ncbi:fungal-specific transcription factor domain-containing protein [Ilyonectria robusta]|uniref:fungal-specific transcription factor domain-containing protein n=1 Tax=Ilyonectria robusta TaxID=1079257 RepID=UPI001E8CFC99|nr:fungal-specific transcription factor domain-containing protein [Ilyonectria robusta]KAH8666114.1 fungal-specific transcription factor domain-containing protein [Ilyonectria robusta]